VVVLRYAVIGLGRFGSTLARHLGDLGAEVVAIDHREDRVAEVRDHVSVAIRLDATTERNLRDQGLEGIDVAVVGMGEKFEAAQLVTVILKRLGVKHVVVKAPTPLQHEILTRIGADEVVSPEKESAIRLAQRLLSPRILDYIELAEGFSLVQILAPEKFTGKSLRELDVRNVFGVNVVAIKRTVETGRDEAGYAICEERIMGVTDPTDVIVSGDVLFVIGADADLDRLANG
jgi:trk system potassium uptake protein TrkA